MQSRQSSSDFDRLSVLPTTTVPRITRDIGLFFVLRLRSGASRSFESTAGAVSGCSRFRMRSSWPYLLLRPMVFQHDARPRFWSIANPRWTEDMARRISLRADEVGSSLSDAQADRSQQVLWCCASEREARLQATLPLRFRPRLRQAGWNRE